MEPNLWPLFCLSLAFEERLELPFRLRAANPADLGVLAEIEPDDFDHDPDWAPLPGLDAESNRRWQFHQSMWRAWGDWRIDRWRLPFVVELEGYPVGLQQLEADHFLTNRTVDSWSWLVPALRGQGLGIAMRRAMLALAFDGLGATVAVTSASIDNASSLGVSRHLGYRDAGGGRNLDGQGEVDLQHLILDRGDWHDAGWSDGIIIEHLEPALPWFGLA